MSSIHVAKSSRVTDSARNRATFIEEVRHAYLSLSRSADWHFLIEAVIDRDNIAPHSAPEMVEDYLRFLCLCGTKSPAEPQFSPSEPIDIVWHRHILHTRHYAQTCVEHFGTFVHHQPFGRAEKAAMIADGQGRRAGLASYEYAMRCFGTLSPNWESLLATADSCSGSTNCQSCSKCW